MKRIKVIVVTALLFFLTSIAIVFNACNPDPCKDMVCKNNGVCREGTCKCSLGFEGPFCATRMYEKFIGTYDGYYRCNGLTPVLRTLVITPEAQPNRVAIYHLFENTDDVMLATIGVDGTEKIVLDAQTVGNYVYSGNGYISGLDITLFIQQLNLTDSVFNTCTYNGNKFID